MLRTAKSANVGFRQVVQLFAPPTNPALQLPESSFYKSAKTQVGVNNGHTNIRFSRISGTF